MRRAVVAALALLGGCATGSPPPSPVADPPAHTVGNVDVACFRARLESYTVDQGFVIRSSSDSRLVAGRTVHSIGPSLFGTRDIGAPEERIMLTLIPLGGNRLRVVMQGGFTTRPGTDFRDVTPVAPSARDIASFAGQLDRMAAACPAGRPPAGGVRRSR